MPSASKEKRLAKRAAEGKEKKTVASRSKANSKNASAAGSVNGDDTPPVELDANGNPIEADEPATSAEKMDEVKRLAEQMDKHGLSDRVTTGVLASTAASKDVKITSVSLVFHGRVLISDSTLELTLGRRYGLLGENGCGKSTLLKAIAAREYPIPEHVDIYLLNEGAPPTDMGALEWVVKEAELEMERLDKLAEKLLEEEGPESPVLMDLYDVCAALTYSSLQNPANSRHSIWKRWIRLPSRPAHLSF
jgi:ATP-binding cassette subfamily F protein 2